MNRTEAEAIIVNALEMCNIRQEKNPSSTVLVSIEKQLLFLLEFIKDGKGNKKRINDIILGQYGVKEFEPGDMEFANKLYEAEEVVRYLKKSL